MRSKINRRRIRGVTLATIVLSLPLLGGLAAYEPAAASTTTCVTLPLSTTGATIGIGGRTIRIPALSNPGVCLSETEYSSLTVDQSGNGICQRYCYTASVTGTNDPGVLTLFYTTDGAPTSVRLDLPAVLWVNFCLSMGSPSAPRPDCYVFISVDQLPA